MPNDNSDRPFNLEIELAKLQAKVSEMDTFVSMGLAIAFSMMVSLIVVVYTVPAEQRLPAGNLSIAFIAAGVLFFWIIYVRNVMKTRTRKDIKRIYNNEHIDY